MRAWKVYGGSPMTTSILFARFLGPVMLIAAASMLSDRNAIRDIVQDFMESPALIYLAGVMTLAMGIAIITFHNFWVPDWRIIITFYGYVAVVSGIFRMAFPTQVKQLGEWMLLTPYIIRGAAVLNLIIGGFLTWKGFLSGISFQ